MAYAVIADITARLPNRTIDGSSKPTSTEVEAWITEAEHLLNGELEASGISTPVTGTGNRGHEILTHIVADYVAAQCERAWVSGTTIEDDEIGEDRFERFEAFLQEIRDTPDRVSVKLGLTAGEASRLRGQPTDDQDGGSISDGDFDPEFTRDTAF